MPLPPLSLADPGRAKSATWSISRASPVEILGQAAAPAYAGHLGDVAPTALREDATGHHSPQVAQRVDAGGGVLGRGILRGFDGL